MTIGSKILLGAAVAVALISGVSITKQYLMVKHDGIESAKAKLVAAVTTADNMRASIAKLNTAHAFDDAKLLKEAQKSDDYRKTTLYTTIPIVAAWQALEEEAKHEGFTLRVPKTHPRNPSNEPKPEEAAILKKMESGEIDDYFHVDNSTNTITYAKAIKLTADCLKCHGDPATSLTMDGKDPLGFPMENWKEGETHGAFFLTQNTDEMVAATRNGIIGTFLWMLPAAGLVMAGFYCLNRFMIVRPLSMVIDSINSASQQTSAASTQTSSSSQSLAQGASEQAASLEETSSALEEISSMTKKNAETAKVAAQLAGEAESSSKHGNQAMSRMSSAIDEIQSRATETARIVKTIDEIAFQTNLLALNAAVEAARAGEAGKGFAVVAEEVRNLAMRAGEAAKNTGQLIEASVTSSKSGVALAREVESALSQITQTSTRVNGLINEIASASVEQSTGIQQVNQSVAQMDKVTQTNAATAEESAAASEELASQAVLLADSVKTLSGLVKG
jgi:methyl-accepting chemotaxis protein